MYTIPAKPGSMGVTSQMRACCLIVIALPVQLVFDIRTCHAGFQALMSLPGMQDLLEALASYTQRHFVRIDRLVRSSFLLDYTLASMNVILPEADGNRVQDMQLFAEADVSLQQANGAAVDTVKAADDIQAVLAQQTLPADILQEQDTQEGNVQQELDSDPHHGVTDGGDGHSQKAQASIKRRKSGNKSAVVEPSAAVKTVRAKRKKLTG